MTNTVHWLGAGLSSAPGIRKLAIGKQPLVLWNRSLDKAQALVQNFSTPVTTKVFQMDALSHAISPGDIIVSMLPADMHVKIANLALQNKAHFVSSSYIAPDMAALNEQVTNSGLSFVNEVGLDPGLDHLMAHSLVSAYKNSASYDPQDTIAFRSYCGGFPQTPTDFRYKFSWSPLGVLNALRSPATCIRDGAVFEVERPWQALGDYIATLPSGAESFQSYPNRDSLPFVKHYNFGSDWQVEEFVRGTLRLPGWSDAWADLFVEIDSLEGAAGDQRLRAISDELWHLYSYNKDEPDRVVLCVELQANRAGSPVWHQSYAIDASGNDTGSAMARLVSLPVALTVEGIAAGEFDPGVQAAPSDTRLIAQWFDCLSAHGDGVFSHNYV